MHLSLFTDPASPLRTIPALILCIFSLSLPAYGGLGMAESIVADSATGNFPLVTQEKAAPLWYDADDYPGVTRAIDDLRIDIGRVTSREPALSTARPKSKTPVIIGTLGKSRLIDSLVKAGKIHASPITGIWESFIITTVMNPWPGIDQALVIVGSDKRGTIYGIYEVSEQIGVSPWYWWADVPTRHRDTITIKKETYIQGPPAVKYRGIFINDEEPALGPWAREKFGGINSKMYVHMFELVLRLRGNYLWPAMWGKSFNEDDPENPRLADEYGIVMGTSHHEPMIRAQQEWTKRKSEIGNGKWNYLTNQNGLAKFWRDGVERNGKYDNLITIGMRGDGDEPMAEDGNMKANIDLLERIVADQRKMITETVNPEITKTPQLWALYKEVADYYAHGMKVPDDISLLWCDDNWGNLRRVPTATERNRSGGAGIYYHFDYVGSPRSYKWINTNPLPKVWEQMNLAYDYGANRIWIVNVGDLKPMELPIEFFLRMAWNPKAITKENIDGFTHRWAEREFGNEHAAAIADIVSKYAKFNGWRKPELLEPSTFSSVNYQEAERVLAAWQSITHDAENIYAQLTPEFHDAFYQLVLYPTKASATVTRLYIEAGRNQLYAAQGRNSANDHAERARELFKQDDELSKAYHQISGGKWNHMMDQTHIGYTSWKDPQTNILPKLTEVKPSPETSLCFAIEGSDTAWPGNTMAPELPAFDSLNQQHRWIDIFKRGDQNYEFTASADQPWVILTATSGTVDKDVRVFASVDWNQVPIGSHRAVITISRTDGEHAGIQMTAIRSDQFTRENVHAYGGLTGPTAISADSATKNIAADGVRWEQIPDYGRGRSGMSPFPTTAASVTPPIHSAALEYPVFIATPGEIHVDLITGPTLNVLPDRGVRIGVSFDNQPPQIIDAFTDQSYADPSKRPDLSSPPIKDWHKWVTDNARTLKSTHQIPGTGIHTLKVWMVDPGVVLETLIIHDGNLPTSYFGPPEAALLNSTTR